MADVAGYGFVTEAGGQNAREFKYSGTDLSLIYKYALSPFAQALVDITPRWVAPNLITFVGLLLIIFSHTALAWFSPDLYPTAPNWVFALQAICLFTYSTLDNMDGKQARRTGSSSSLGVLFDHGCDAINAGILSATSFSAAIGTGPTIYSYIIFVSVICPFYFASWEEFHIHSFVLPIINGPNEGIIATVLVYLYTAYAGPGWTSNELAMGVTWFQFIMFLAIASSVGTCLMQTVTVYNKLRNTPGEFGKAIGRLAPLLVVSVSGAAWCLVSPHAMTAHIRLLYLIMGSVFADSVMKLVLAHVCKQPFMPSYVLLAMLPLGPLNAVFGVVSETTLMWVMLVVSMANLCLFVVVATKELMAALDVNCFTIKPKSS